VKRRRKWFTERVLIIFRKREGGEESGKKNATSSERTVLSPRENYDRVPKSRKVRKDCVAEKRNGMKIIRLQKRGGVSR